MITCRECQTEILYEKNAIYFGPTGRERKKPLCVYCYEDAVRKVGRSAAKVRRAKEKSCDDTGDEAQWAFWYEHPQFRIQGLD